MNWLTDSPTTQDKDRESETETEIETHDVDHEDKVVDLSTNPLPWRNSRSWRKIKQEEEEKVNPWRG